MTHATRLLAYAALAAALTLAFVVTANAQGRTGEAAVLVSQMFLGEIGA